MQNPHKSGIAFKERLSASPANALHGIASHYLSSLTGRSVLRTLFLLIPVLAALLPARAAAQATAPATAPTAPAPQLSPSAAAPDSTLIRLWQFVRNVNTFNRVFPQEKVYLHLDNSGYFMGESIYYKAYVVRPDSLCFTNLSRVLYVELIDPFGETVETQKLKLDNGQAHGSFSLKELRTDGFYELRAYTRYMTNWDASGFFSRAIPIFEKPEREGDYSQRRIHLDFADVRSTHFKALQTTLPFDTAAIEEQALSYLTPESSTSPRKRKKDTDDNVLVSFHPEGGELVRGLTSLVAFAVTAPDTLIGSARGWLLSPQGDTLSAVSTLREGRGTFYCTPDSGRQVLRLSVAGRTRDFPLPTALSTGCVLSVDALAAHTVGVQATATPDLHGTLMGLSLMHNGNIVYFDTLRLGSKPAAIFFDRATIPAGVNQLTLFDADGRIRAERQFFVIPDTADQATRIRATFANTTIAAYRKMRLQLTAPPRTRLSVSVADAATTTNDRGGNVATWLLLASDLRGYVSHAAYYLEADDAPHRQAADLLMLVQGWRRYNWRVMSGNAPFEKRQPIEDRLYLDGRILPRRLYADGAFSTKKKKASAADVSDVRLNATLYNKEGEVLRGNLITERDGHYAFSVPECTGDWTLVLSTKKSEKYQNYVVSINRRFAPQPRDFDSGEAQLYPVTGTPFRFRTGHFTPIDSLPNDDKSVRLGQAVVKADGKKTGRLAWEYRRRSAERLSELHFNLEDEAEKFYDRGEEPPFMARWLLTHPIIFREYFVKRRALGWIKGGNGDVNVYLNGETTTLSGKGGSGIAMLTHPDYLLIEKANHHVSSVKVKPENAAQIFRGLCKGELLPTMDWAPEMSIDEFREVYVAFDVKTTEFISHYENANQIVERDRPIYVFYYPHYMRNIKHKGVRTTRYQGFNQPVSFQANDYSLMPPQEDFRRTLFWEPDVQTDEEGHATVEFYNNSTCRELLLSVEGLTPEGLPAVFR